jgi:hypothetical protein
MTYDYGEHAPGPPSAEAIAIRDRLAKELASALPGSPPWEQAEERLVLHMLTEELPLEHFSTSSGQAFEIVVQVTKVVIKPGLEKEARAWLDGRNAKSVARKIVLKGGSLPPDLFEPVETKIRVNLPKSNKRKNAPPQRR